jgi:hypothetical protein
VRGWFGSGRIGPGEGQTLSLTGRVFETFDNQHDTSYPDLQAGVRYDRKTRKRSLYVTANTSSQHFADFGGLSSSSHDVAAGFATSLGRRTRVQFDQSFRTSPFYLVTVFPRQLPEEPTESIQAPESPSDYALFRRKTNSLTSGLAVTHLLARHSSLTFNYGHEQSRSDDTDFSAHYVKASFNQHLGRYVIARAGYGRWLVDRDGLATSNEPGVAAIHDIDAGIDYNRPLSLSRRTKLFITTGSAIVPAAERRTSVNGVAHYRLLGTASLNREMGRTWNAALSYGRNLEFVETFAEPLLSNTLALRVGGNFTRRVDVAVSANLAKGSVGFAAGDPNQRFGTYNASARLQWAVTRFMKTYGEYIAYGHAFGSDVQAPPGFGRDVKRSEIRVGLTLWAPLVR